MFFDPIFTSYLIKKIFFISLINCLVHMLFSCNTNLFMVYCYKGFTFVSFIYTYTYVDHLDFVYMTALMFLSIDFYLESSDSGLWVITVMFSHCCWAMLLLIQKPTASASPLYFTHKHESYFMQSLWTFITLQPLQNYI